MFSVSITLSTLTWTDDTPAESTTVIGSPKYSLSRLTEKENTTFPLEVCCEDLMTFEPEVTFASKRKFPGASSL
jgi:hypothetical protein